MNSSSHFGAGYLSLGLLALAGSIHQTHSATPSVGIERSNDGLQIHFHGALESARQAEGPYQRVAGAVSPWTPTPGNERQFWRASLPGMSTLAAGRWHTVAVRADGSLWTWGSNSHGQLGNAVQNSPLPQRVGTENSWVAVAAGRFYTVALKADASLWAWGDNELGQIAQGSFWGQFNNPVRIGSATNWLAVQAGHYHVVALQEDSSLWIWGGNPGGQLSNLSWASTNRPQALKPADRWLSVAAGDGHTMAVRADGTLWTCGSDDSGQLGYGVPYMPGFPPFFHGTTNLQQVGTDTNWASVLAGGNRSLATRTDGTLWAWGNNIAGQCGAGTPAYYIWKPFQLGEAQWDWVSAGESHTVAVKNGTLWMWGNTFGWSTNIFTTPQRVDTNEVWSAVAAGTQHTVGLRTDGTLWGWGFNDQGQLGNGSSTNCARPIQIPGGAVWGPKH